MIITPESAEKEQMATRDWESEGGSLSAPQPPPLPEGIIATQSTRYHVGSFSYSKLEDALAEHARQSDR